jgi:hypothetical protein
MPTTQYTLLEKLALTSPTIGGLLVGIVHLQTKRHGVCLFRFEDLE